VSKSFAGKRILVVEDDGVVAMMLSDQLDELGFATIELRYSLASALVAATDHLPDVALLDLHLTDGLSLPIAQVLAGRGIPSVFMSGDQDAESKLGLATGSVLLKPFSPAELQAALTAALSGSEAEQT
jgi:DNA-binding response OmpR family regulator